MATELIPWYKQKTTWPIIAGMVGSVGAYFTGEIGAFAMIGAILVGFSGIFMRQGVEKSRITVVKGEELK